MLLSRRSFLQVGLAVLGSGAKASPDPAGRTRLILLGTGGGPRPRKTSSGSAQVIVSDGRACVVDCGDGVARQLVLADIPLRTLRHVFLTHHHSDHNADYGNLLLLSWASGLSTHVDTWGPPPVARMTRLFLEMNAEDIRTRISNEGRPALAPLIKVHALRGAGPVFRDDRLTVTCTLVDHPPVVPAFGYRFDGPDRSIVISGDTRPSANLARLARGADVLVHSAMYPPAIDRLVAGVPSASTLRASILAHQTSAEDAGRIAAEAGVMLVLSHLVPAEDPLLTEELWLEAARTQFGGRIVVGRDLMEL